MNHLGKIILSINLVFLDWFDKNKTVLLVFTIIYVERYHIYFSDHCIFCKCKGEWLGLNFMYSYGKRRVMARLACLLASYWAGQENGMTRSSKTIILSELHLRKRPCTRSLQYILMALQGLFLLWSSELKLRTTNLAEGRHHFEYIWSILTEDIHTYTYMK
jgi:hypothetical protein